MIEFLAPYKFKCCNCDAPVGCNCEVSGSPTIKVNGQNSFDELEITSFSTSIVAEQLTLVDAVSIPINVLAIS